MSERPGHRYRPVRWAMEPRDCECGKPRGHVIHERNLMVSDERWKGREQGARRGRQLRKRELRATRGGGATGCAVTALAIGGAAASAWLGWRGLR